MNYVSMFCYVYTFTLKLMSAEKCRLFLILKTKYLSQMCGRRDGERGSNEPFMELIWAFSKSLASSGGLVKNMP